MMHAIFMFKWVQSTPGKMIEPETYVMLQNNAFWGKLCARTMSMRFYFCHYSIVVSHLHQYLVDNNSSTFHFSDALSSIEGAIDLGYSHYYGSDLFDKIAAKMAADVLAISSASARRLSNSLASGFKNDNVKDDATSIIVSNNLQEVHPLKSCPSCANPPTPTNLSPAAYPLINLRRYVRSPTRTSVSSCWNPIRERSCMAM